uniref:Uncharacterized protein n=1 Tax=Anguilla anguilla TaxID=7936 RepID=A0A0E9UEJ1_ANGAN
MRKPMHLAKRLSELHVLPYYHHICCSCHYVS